VFAHLLLLLGCPVGHSDRVDRFYSLSRTIPEPRSRRGDHGYQFGSPSRPGLLPGKAVALPAFLVSVPGVVARRAEPQMKRITARGIIAFV
jgi:hypothetical protein